MGNSENSVFSLIYIIFYTYSCRQGQKGR